MCPVMRYEKKRRPFYLIHVLLVSVGDSENKAIYEDIDDECLECPPPEWSSTKKREKSENRARQSCSTISDESEQWNDYEAAYSDEEVDVETTDFDVMSEDSSKVEA